jgi:hypothetical protein
MGQPGATVLGARKKGEWGSRGQPRKGGKGLFGRWGLPRKRRQGTIGQPGIDQKKDKRDHWAAGGSPEKEGQG